MLRLIVAKIGSLVLPKFKTATTAALSQKIQSFIFTGRYNGNTSIRCLQRMNKTAFESLSLDFSLFKNFVVSVPRSVKISLENGK